MTPLFYLIAHCRLSRWSTLQPYTPRSFDRRNIYVLEAWLSPPLALIRPCAMRSSATVTSSSAADSMYTTPLFQWGLKRTGRSCNVGRQIFRRVALTQLMIPCDRSPSVMPGYRFWPHRGSIPLVSRSTLRTSRVVVCLFDIRSPTPFCRPDRPRPIPIMSVVDAFTKAAIANAGRTQF